MEKLNIEDQTHFHSNTVSQISGILADHAGLELETQSIITSAALYHDIGKSCVPESILNKPAKLTSSEFKIVKTHSYMGYQFLLRKARVMLAAAIVALQHHEKPDGSGYAGTSNIHPYAKVVAVADVFDALLSKRPYKKGWSPDEIVGYMQEKKDKEFDATYISALIDSLDDILSLYGDSKSA